MQKTFIYSVLYSIIVIMGTVVSCAADSHERQQTVNRTHAGGLRRDFDQSDTTADRAVRSYASHTFKPMLVGGFFALAALCLGYRSARIKRTGFKGDERKYLAALSTAKRSITGGAVVVILFTLLSWALFGFLFS